MKKNNSFVNVALIYSVTLIIVKMIGAVYKIFLGNVLTDTGASYYAFVYPYFNAMLAITTVGFPAAIAKVTAEYLAEDNILGAEQLFVVMKRFLLLIGVASTAILFLAAPAITSMGGNPKAALSMQAISLALVFVAYMSAYRGFFQGHSNLFPFGMSQIADQIGRVVIGIALAGLLLQYGDEYAAAGATFAATLGTAFGMLTLLYFRKRYQKKSGFTTAIKAKISEHKAEIKRVVWIAIPIIIGASVMPMVNMIDSLIIINRLEEIGYGKEIAKNFYGYHAYFSASLVNFPQVLFTAIQASLLPAVSFAIAAKNEKAVGDTIRTGIKVAFIVGVPAAIGLSILAQPIITLLFPSKPNVIMNTPGILSIAALALIPLSLFQATTGILQGMEKQKLPARNLLIGALFKIVVCYILVGIPEINVKGAAISTLLAFLIAAILNVHVLFKYSKPNYHIFSIIIKPLFAALLMGAAVWLSYRGFAGFISIKPLVTLLSIMVGVAIYAVLIIVSKALDSADLEYLPGKKYLAKVIR